MVISVLLYAIVFYDFGNYYGVTCELLPREVVEDGQKNPIFGSYCFNPLTNTFEERQTDYGQLQTVTSPEETTVLLTTRAVATSAATAAVNETATTKARYRMRRRRIPASKYNMINSELREYI